MPFSVSPSVTVTEVDQSSIIPQVATTTGAFVGRFDAGPVNKIIDISSEKELFQVFGSPSAGERGTDWWVCANFLNYTNRLKVVRIDETGPQYAANGGGASGLTAATARGSAGATSARIEFNEPGAKGNSVRLIVWPAGCPNPVRSQAGGGYAGASGSIEHYGDNANLFSYTPTTTEGVFNSWQSGILAGGSSTSGNTLDEVHIALVDHKGLVTSRDGSTGAILEKWEGLSMWRGAYDNTGKNLYYKDVINDESNLINIEENIHRSIFNHALGNALNIAGNSGGDPLWTPDSESVVFMPGYGAGGSADYRGWVQAPLARNTTFIGGAGSGVTWPAEGAGSDSNALAAFNPHVAAIKSAYRKHFRDSEKVDVDLLISGAAGAEIATELVDIAETRKDCVAFISPPASPAGTEFNDVVYQSSLNGYSGPDSVINYRLSNNFNSSYAVMDSGWKYLFDSYNGIFRWTPLNGDTAGLVARTENQQEPWFSPAGFNRGRVQGVVKLALNPSKAERDRLYQNGVNPIVSFPGEGTVLFGDKTLQRRPSALDRINVRRLMIFLEKAIATAAKFQLFEFNDAFTRRAFVSTITPFLRRVQAQRGLTDFRVVCDDTNNPTEVVEKNQFVADIFIKPALSINFINLNFVVVRQDALFTETT